MDPSGDSGVARESRPRGACAAEPCERPRAHLPREGASQAGEGARADDGRAGRGDAPDAGAGRVPADAQRGRDPSRRSDR